MSEAKKLTESKIISYRKVGKSTGENTGLSHYIFSQDEQADNETLDDTKKLETA